jgi:flagellar hook-length control protein FliK
MQSAPANHASILPVFEIGSSGGAPRDLGDGAAFDELLSAPPPTCPPPPREPEPQKQTDESAQSAAPTAEASDSDPQAEVAGETPQSEATAEAAKVVDEKADDDDEASDADEQSVAESLAGLAPLIPLVPPTPPVPEVEVVADAAAPAVEPASQAPADAHEGESPVVTAVTAIESPTDEAQPTTAEQKESAPAEAVAQNAESQLVSPIQEAGADTSDGQATASSVEQPQAESASDDGREDNSAKSATAASLPTDAALAKNDQQTSAKSSEAAPPPVAAPESKSNTNESARSTPTVTPGIEAAGSSAPRSRLPAALLAREPSGAQPATQIDSVRLLNRVARAFTAAQQRDGGEIQLRLSPAELGSLRLLIQVHEGALTARLEAETPAARTALIDNLPALREKLAEQGVRIERFDVDLMQRQPGGMPNQPQDQERSAPPPRLVNNPRQTAPPPVRPVPPRATGPGQLNVII